MKALKIRILELFLGERENVKSITKNQLLIFKNNQGITDNKTSRATIDSIMVKLKNEPFNQLIIVTDYGRADVDFYNHLEIMERCLNGVVDSSVMLIINKVPNRARLETNLEEDASFDLEQNLKRLRDEVARIFKFQFSADFSLVEENGDEADAKENNKVLEKMRKLIQDSESYSFSNTKTWSNLVKIAEDSHQSTYDETALSVQIKSDLKDKIAKIGSNVYYKESQIDWINRGQWGLAGAEVGITFMRFSLLLPLVQLGKTKLEEYKEKQINEVNRLKEEIVNEEKRLADIEINNYRLKEERENFKKEIYRLQTLLREN